MLYARLPAALLALLALCALLACARAETAEVRSCAELRAALGDAGVDHVLLMPRPGPGGGWNCTSDDLPERGVEIAGREVLIEGHGPEPVYYNANRGGNQVLVGQGGNVTVRNLWLDNCVRTLDPFVCLVNALPGGRLSLEHMQVSDPDCVNTKRSEAIGTAMVAVRYIAEVAGSRLDISSLNARTLLLSSDWLEASPGTQARYTNVKFTCTAGVTFPVPEGVELDGALSSTQLKLLVTGGLGLMLMSASLLWVAVKRARGRGLPEFKIAASKGYELEEPLGSGHFGRVYKARSKSSGQPVAVKVIDLLPSQRRQVAAAYRECQLMSRIQHDCIVRVITFYTAQVQQQRHIVEPTPGNQYVELGYNIGSVLDATQAPPGTERILARSHSGSGSAGGRLASSGSGASSSEGIEGLVSIQVQLVMQYCDMGSLEQAIRGGVFKDPETDKLRVRAVVATALEIAQGLQYLHHQERRMVHRDLSASNVLLTTAAGDERGFRALLSDFGLSTSLSQGATHRTSEVKGTLSYMSPEIFVHDDVSPALDIYSLGVLMHMMCTGADPYAGMTSAVIILSKVRASDHPDAARLPAIDGIPQALQQLVWDCTAHSRQARPSAATVVRRLEALLARL